MNALTYESPGSLDEAVKLLAAAKGNAKVLAGGTDLLVQLRMGMIKPAMIIDIKKIPELTAINEENGGYRVGASVSGAVLGEHGGMKAAWPGVVEAFELIGSTQIQGRASMGGNLCNGSPAADAVPAMIAADAVCTIAGPNGRREAKVEDIVTGPGQTSLANGEIVVDFLFPARPARSGDAYLRFIARRCRCVHRRPRGARRRRANPLTAARRRRRLDRQQTRRCRNGEARCSGARRLPADHR